MSKVPVVMTEEVDRRAVQAIANAFAEWLDERGQAIESNPRHAFNVSDDARSLKDDTYADMAAKFSTMWDGKP